MARCWPPAYRRLRRAPRPRATSRFAAVVQKDGSCWLSSTAAPRRVGTRVPEIAGRLVLRAPTMCLGRECAQTSTHASVRHPRFLTGSDLLPLVYAEPSDGPSD